MEGFEPEKHEDIIVYRSEAEMVANCPLQRVLSKDAPESQDDLPMTGKLGHKLIEESIRYALDNRFQSDAIADYFEQEVTKTRPDLQPQILEAYRGIIYDLLYMSIAEIIGVEIQIDHELLPATKSRGRVVISTKLDLLQTGFGESLLFRDWKSGWLRRSKQEVWESFQAQYITYILWQAYDGNHKSLEGEELPKVDIIKGVFHETRFGGKIEADYHRDKHPYRMPELTQEMQFLGRITEAIRLILSGCDEAWPSEHKCLWCGVIGKCKYANVSALEFVNNQEEFINRTHVMDLLVKKYKKTIKDFILGGGVCEYEFMTACRKTPKDVFTLAIKDSRVKPKAKKKTVKKKAVKK